MSHADIQQRISDDLNDQCRGTGNWCYLVAVFGDDKSGDCVYSCSGDLCRAPYTCSEKGAKVDMAAAVDVVPMTTYEVESGELMEAGARNSQRDLKQLQSIHDASASLGAMCQARESAVVAGGPLQLTESAATLENIVLREARADYEIKLIAPGKGSSAFYPAEVLKRDGPKVFKASTHVYLNHPTAAEEAQRPEGDVANLAGVLTTDAVYHEAHAKGPGLYARMKVFADHAQMVEEKAPHVGMSIRASGVAESGTKREGVPVLKELVAAESVDVVTRAGAGGMILTEAARTAESQQEANMDAAELQKLTEAQAALAEQNRKLLERAIRGDAREFAVRTLKGVSLQEADKDFIIETVMRESIPQKDGALDETKFKETIDAEAKRVGALLASRGTGARPIGMGAAPVVNTQEAERNAAQLKAEEDRAIQGFMAINMTEAQARAAVRGQEAA